MNLELKQAAQQALDAFDSFGEDDDFERLFALSQKMEALRTAIQQATQPVEVTDEQIESCALEAGFSVESNGFIWAVDGAVGTRVDPGLRKFAKAILALRPGRVPMTDSARENFLAGYESAQQDALVCRLPPNGWACTRKAGHDGPCAAVPTDDEAFVKRGMDRL